MYSYHMNSQMKYNFVSSIANESPNRINGRYGQGLMKAHHIRSSTKHRSDLSKN